jgi:hypothetical protein
VTPLFLAVHSACGVQSNAEDHIALIAIRIWYRRLNMLAAEVHLPLLFAVAFLSSSPSFAQLNVITSVGFAAAYNELVPDFQKSSGITVSTKHFARVRCLPAKQISSTSERRSL